MPFDVTRERLAGYRDGLGDAWNPALVLTATPNRQETARVLLPRLLALDEPPTAVLAMSDALAIGAVREAIQRGLEVPGALSVIGFDDVPLAAGADPPLTTVSQPTEEKGARAARALLEALEAPELPEPTRTMLPTKLVVRGTTAPPR